MGTEGALGLDLGNLEVVSNLYDSMILKDTQA